MIQMSISVSVTRDIMFELELKINLLCFCILFHWPHNTSYSLYPRPCFKRVERARRAPGAVFPQQNSQRGCGRTWVAGTNTTCKLEKLALGCQEHSDALGASRTWRQGSIRKIKVSFKSSPQTVKRLCPQAPSAAAPPRRSANKPCSPAGIRSRIELHRCRGKRDSGIFDCLGPWGLTRALSASTGSPGFFWCLAEVCFLLWSHFSDQGGHISVTFISQVKQIRHFLQREDKEASHRASGLKKTGSRIPNYTHPSCNQTLDVHLHEHKEAQRVVKPLWHQHEHGPCALFLSPDGSRSRDAMLVQTEVLQINFRISVPNRKPTSASALQMCKKFFGAIEGMSSKTHKKPPLQLH